MHEPITVQQIVDHAQAQADMLRKLAAEFRELQEQVQRLTAERDTLQTQLAEAKRIRQEYSQALFRLLGHDDDEETIMAEIAEIQRNPVGSEEIMKVIEELERQAS